MNMLTKAAVQGAACGLMIGAVLLLGGRVWRPAAVEAQAKQAAVADVVKARSFEVVDTAGKLRASLSLAVDGSSPYLVLFDTAGKTRARLSMVADILPSLMLSDAAGKVRASLNVGINGSPSLTLDDAAGKVRAIFCTTCLESVKTGETTIRRRASLALFDKDGKTLWSAP